jgi:hypothetical protein
MLDLCRGKGVGKYLMLRTENYCQSLGNATFVNLEGISNTYRYEFTYPIFSYN